MNAYIKTKKTVIKFGDIEIHKQELHQHEGPISIKKMDINKMGVSNKVCFGKKKDLNILLATKMLKKLSPYVYFSPK